MHPEIVMLLVREHQAALLEEARSERLAATAGGRPRRLSRLDGPGGKWRRFVRAATTDFGTRPSARLSEPVSDPRW